MDRFSTARNSGRQQETTETPLQTLKNFNSDSQKRPVSSRSAERIRRMTGYTPEEWFRWATFRHAAHRSDSLADVYGRIRESCKLLEETGNLAVLLRPIVLRIETLSRRASRPEEGKPDYFGSKGRDLALSELEYFASYFKATADKGTIDPLPSIEDRSKGIFKIAGKKFGRRFTERQREIYREDMHITEYQAAHNQALQDFERVMQLKTGSMKVFTNGVPYELDFDTLIGCTLEVQRITLQGELEAIIGRWSPVDAVDDVTALAMRDKFYQGELKNRAEHLKGVANNIEEIKLIIDEVEKLRKATEDFNNEFKGFDLKYWNDFVHLTGFRANDVIRHCYDYSLNMGYKRCEKCVKVLNKHTSNMKFIRLYRNSVDEYVSEIDKRIDKLNIDVNKFKAATNMSLSEFKQNRPKMYRKDNKDRSKYPTVPDEWKEWNCRQHALLDRYENYRDPLVVIQTALDTIKSKRDLNRAALLEGFLGQTLGEFGATVQSIVESRQYGYTTAGEKWCCQKAGYNHSKWWRHLKLSTNSVAVLCSTTG
jgi:hypothetical protein